MTLTEFLLARIAEDEDNAEMGASWGLTRVLAECEAKRQIIALHPEILELCQGCAHESYPCRTLSALALPYAAHPDEWRP